jgi:CDP-paratose 2-epimerase
MEGLTVRGVDNLMRPGAHLNRLDFVGRGVDMVHGDLRCASDLDGIPQADWVIDAAANPSVLAGVDGRTSSRQLSEHNLQGTINLLEYCKRHRSGLVLLSTSRVYGIKPLSELPVEVEGKAFRLRKGAPLPKGAGPDGVTEDFSTRPPLSLYGNAKLCSELLALEYGDAFGFPVWVNRCGVLAGPGQFGRPDQGIFSYWIHAWHSRRPLRYIGFEGKGFQVRDALHPRDLATLVALQLRRPKVDSPQVINVAGGLANACSLRELSSWCSERFGVHAVEPDPKARPFDIPWLVLDSGLARGAWGWSPRVRLPEILEEIASHAEANPGWLDLTLS